MRTDAVGEIAGIEGIEYSLGFSKQHIVRRL